MIAMKIPVTTMTKTAADMTIETAVEESSDQAFVGVEKNKGKDLHPRRCLCLLMIRTAMTVEDQTTGIGEDPIVCLEEV